MTKGGQFHAVYAIIRGTNGRRHDDADITVEIYFGDGIFEIVISSPDDPVPADKRRFALLNVPRPLFNQALGEAARRSKGEGSPVLAAGS